jgi:hypothetical protein
MKTKIDLRNGMKPKANETTNCRVGLSFFFFFQIWIDDDDAIILKVYMWAHKLR